MNICIRHSSSLAVCRSARRAITAVIIQAVTCACSFAQITSPKERVDAGFRELDSNQVTIRIVHALTGRGVAGARIAIDPLGRFLTDNNGRAFVALSQEEGSLSMEVKADGFIDAAFDLEVLAGSLFFSQFSISPVMDIRSLRVALDWDHQPRDLDAHLVKSNGYHISFRDMRSVSDGAAKLDRDDMDGNGPETITVAEASRSGLYVYFVHNYSDRQDRNSTGLVHSKASVKVYGEGRLLRVFEVPREGVGNVWNVFTIEGGQIRAENRIADDRP